ncbi:hypothetical protein FKP32DRAFT_1677165 [Trametes sanguinea]|nr:hypothetical protein FKP32DRAFT_1677165 [Trametes sanguinea]
MPPECKSGLPGYQVARKGWTAREVKKLRERGLMPTRVLIREDGMVIDWKSKVPVLSDTLQPPPSGAGAAVTDPPVVSEQERIERGPSRSNSISTQVAVADNPDEPAAPLLVAALGKPRIPRVKPRPIPPSGQTVWESVSLPPRRPPAPSLAAPPEPSRSSGTDGSRTLRRKSAPVPELPTNASGKPAAVSKPPDTHSDSTRSSVPADVEIIDLTCDPDDDADPHRSSSSSPEPLAQLTARRRPRLLPTPDDTPPVHLSSPAGSPEIQEQAPSALRSSAPVQPRPNRYRRLDTAVVDIDLTEEADIDETQAEAIRFLERYLKTFMLDRSDLASAYSHTATFSVQILPPSPQTGLRPVGTTYPPSCHHQGRLAVIAALLDLPEDKFAEPDAGGVPQRKFDWDFCHAREAGDVLLICSSVTAMPLWESDVDAGAGAKGKGKGKERAAEDDSGPSRARLGVCEQRFVLRSRDWDEEDRSTPGVWPLVAVAHHMLYRPLPPR